jgi:hypothetical protein
MKSDKTILKVVSYLKPLLVTLGVIAIFDWFIIPLLLGLPIMAQWR